MSITHEPRTAAGQEPIGCLAAVVVVYNQEFSKSCAHRSISAMAQAHPGKLKHVFVYDNSRSRCSPPEESLPSLGISIHERHDPQNGGLVPAYNWASQRATELGCDWILLIDQDATLPPDYLKVFSSSAGTFHQDVVAAIPHVRAGGKRIAPQGTLAGLTLPWPLPKDAVGPQATEVVGINSGTFVRLTYLAMRGGWDSRYSLDAVDFWFFAEVYANRKLVAILPCEIAHALSVADLSTISLRRYESVVRAEREFYLHMRPRRTQFLASQMMFARAAKNLLTGRLSLARIGAREAALMFSRGLRRR